MPTTKKQTTLEAVMPFFIVGDLKASVDFYVGKLGFEIDFASPPSKPIFAIVRRDQVRLMLKEIGPDIRPEPNHQRHAWARWDAYINTSDPDVLADEYKEKELKFHRSVADTEEGLRAFEIKDNSGYVLCFGRPK